MFKGDEVLSSGTQEYSNGMVYEVKDFKEVMENEDYDTCFAWLEQSVKVIQVIEKMRKEAGIFFAADQA